MSVYFDEPKSRCAKILLRPMANAAVLGGEDAALSVNRFLDIFDK